MKSVSRDDIINGDLTGLFLVYSRSGLDYFVQSIEDELQVRFEKMGYPFDLNHEGYGGDFSVKGLLYRALNKDAGGNLIETVFYLKAQYAPFLRSDVADTEAHWVQYLLDLVPLTKSPTNTQLEELKNFADVGAWGSNDWRMVRFQGQGRAVYERGIINWGRKKLPISSWDGEK